MMMNKNKLMIWRADSGIVHPSSSSPLGHWGIVSHLKRSSLEDGDGVVNVDTNVDDQGEKEDKDCNQPDCSHWEELVSLVLVIAYIQEQAFAFEVMVSFEDPFLFVCILTAFFVFAIFTLKVIIALKLFLHANLLPGKHPISRRAHHLLLLLTVSTHSSVKEPFSPGRAAAGGRPSLAPKKRLAFRMGKSGKLIS